MHGMIITRKGLPILIDEADRELLEQHTWAITQVGKNGKFYAYAWVGEHRVSMQRFLLGLEVGDPREGDHINGCTVDNRRDNLRIVTDLQNCWNRAFYKNNASGLRGVSFHARLNKWQARIYRDGKRVSLGYYLTAEEASDAYSIAFNQIQTEHLSNVPH